MQSENILHAEKKMGFMPLFFSVCMAFITLFYIKNSGGAGIELPINLLTLFVIGVFFLYCASSRNHFFRPYYKNIFLLCGLGALAVPWLLDIKQSPGGILLLVAFLAWQWLARLNMHQHTRRFILWAVFLLALAQSIICAIQSFMPQLAGELFEYVWLKTSGRPYGIFQQINVLASFLATGLGCGFLLLRTEEKTSRHLFVIAGLGALAFILGINQSRVGELGIGIVLIGLTVALKDEIPHSRLLAGWGVIIATLLTGVWCANHVHFMINGKEYLLARDFAGSNHNRWHVLKITMQMIALKPWLGWGYGNFEYEFSRYVIAHPELNFSLTENFTHPHNELLYAWFQGGVVALFGMLLLFAGWVKILIEGFRDSRLSGAYALLILPLLLHLNTEYPFYQSFVHFVTFVLLLRIGVIDKYEPQQGVSTTTSLSVRLIYAAAGIALLAFSMAGMMAGKQLTEFERSGLINYPAEMPWYFTAQNERARFDGMISLLMNYNQTLDSSYLKRFMQDAEKYSLRHNDKHVLIYMAVVAHKLGDDRQALQLRQLCMQLFPTHTSNK